eukprot:8861863-Ditylum_brightwellii.AAC.2
MAATSSGSKVAQHPALHSAATATNAALFNNVSDAALSTKVVSSGVYCAAQLEVVQALCVCLTDVVTK